MTVTALFLGCHVPTGKKIWMNEHQLTNAMTQQPTVNIHMHVSFEEYPCNWTIFFLECCWHIISSKKWVKPFHYTFISWNVLPCNFMIIIWPIIVVLHSKSFCHSRTLRHIVVNVIMVASSHLCQNRRWKLFTPNVCIVFFWLCSKSSIIRARPSNSQMN